MDFVRVVPSLELGGLRADLLQEPGAHLGVGVAELSVLHALAAPERVPFGVFREVLLHVDEGLVAEGVAAADVSVPPSPVVLVRILAAHAELHGPGGADVAVERDGTGLAQFERRRIGIREAVGQRERGGLRNLLALRREVAHAPVLQKLVDGVQPAARAVPRQLQHAAGLVDAEDNLVAAETRL